MVIFSIIGKTLTHGNLLIIHVQILAGCFAGFSYFGLRLFDLGLGAHFDAALGSLRLSCIS